LDNLSNLTQQSKSHLTQDLFGLSCLDLKRNGYFVEFGATNGIDLSNTWLLEKNLVGTESLQSNLKTDIKIYLETDLVTMN